MWASHDDFWDSMYIVKCLKVFSNNPDCLSVFCFYSIFDLRAQNIVDRDTPSYGITNDSNFRRVISRINNMVPNLIYGLHKTEIIKKSILTLLIGLM